MVFWALFTQQFLPINFIAFQKPFLESIVESFPACLLVYHLVNISPERLLYEVIQPNLTSFALAIHVPDDELIFHCFTLLRLYQQVFKLLDTVCIHD